MTTTTYHYCDPDHDTYIEIVFEIEYEYRESIEGDGRRGWLVYPHQAHYSSAVAWVGDCGVDLPLDLSVARESERLMARLIAERGTEWEKVVAACEADLERKLEMV